jgi:ATP-dependent Clp protease ATP-binding subunit ClpC
MIPINQNDGVRRLGIAHSPAGRRLNAEAVEMFERFTERARSVVVLSQDEARRLNHHYIGTEHILLGLLHEADGTAAQALESLDVSLDAVRQQVEQIVGRGKLAPSGHIPFTPRAKKVLELSLRESLQLGDDGIGTEHLLLGLLREGDGVAAQVLVGLGCDLNRVRLQVIRLAHGGEAKVARPTGAGEPWAESRQRRILPRERWMIDIEGTLARMTKRIDAIERVLGMSGDQAGEEAGPPGESPPPAGGQTG